MWYPENKNTLNQQLNKFIGKKNNKKVNGIIVPHAGYEYSGEVAGKAFAYLKGKRFKKAIIIGPSHYFRLNEAATSNLKVWRTPLGLIELFNTEFFPADINKEHSITNQVPFLQKLGVKEVMPLMIGHITEEQAKRIAEKIAKIKAVYVFSTDLSHFLPYEIAEKKDKKSIEIIESLNLSEFNKIDACGIYPLLILFHLCKLKKTSPRLIEYKNSGDVTGDNSAVVGYASFFF